MRPLAFGTYAGEADLTADDRLLAAPLAQLGFSVSALQWDRDDLPPSGAGVVFRSCWNYHEKPDAFRAWLDALEARQVRCCNPLPLVRWNLHKRYLLDLTARGAQVPPTLLIAIDDHLTVAELLAQLGTREAVVKPAISMLAHRTFRLSADRLAEGERDLALARGGGEVLVQPFVPEIQTAGETSLVFFDGAYSHAVRKRPAPGDFRSQTDHGGTREPTVPSAAIQRQAERVLACLDERPCIARVDGVEVGDALVLMELELIDPSLFLKGHPEAVEHCTRALAEWFA